MDPTAVRSAGTRSAEPRAGSGASIRTLLLVCGVVSSLLYLAMNVFIPMQWEAYSAVSQTVSELSAIGAPTRPSWVPLGIVYSLLLAGFGCGVRASAGKSRGRRAAGALMIVQGLIGLFWPPMHLRGAEATATDVLHIVWSVATVLLMLLTIGFAAASLGWRFRVYSIATLAIFVVFGTLTGLDGPRIAANLPTPWIGVWERINIAAYMLWIVVLAIALLRAAGAQRAR